MGTINHNAIVATTWDDEIVTAVTKWVGTLETKYRSLFIYGFGICNGFHTIVMIPDGSKEGWNDSENCDEIRKQFVALLDSFAYKDESNPVNYIEVGFGEYGPSIIKSNTKNVFTLTF